MAGRKNVIVFNTDQQRADTLGCMGNGFARTPVLDGLAERGTLYSRHYSSNPICMPSRASFLTGRHVQAHRVLTNGIFLPESELTMSEVFRREGYRTASYGKLHLQTMFPYENDESMESSGRWRRGELDGWTGPYYGFEDVGLVVLHGENSAGHYGQWRQEHFPSVKVGPQNAQDGEVFPLAIYKSNLPLEAHYSTWIADRAIDFLDRAGDQPFYLNVAFPDPHHPFCPPAPYHSMFDDVEFPLPHIEPGENDAKPKVYNRFMRRRSATGNLATPENPGVLGRAYQRMVAHYYGMVSLIDDSVGRVIEKLNQCALADDTIIVFTSDHGDFMGDHNLVLKAGTPARPLLNIPLIVADPDCEPGIVGEVCSNVDVMPTLLAKCGIEIPECVQGVVLPQPGEQATRDHAYEAFGDTRWSDFDHHCLYKKDFRISIFPNLRDGEFYDLRDDPFEHRNLFHDSSRRKERDALLEELAYAMGQAEMNAPIVSQW